MINSKSINVRTRNSTGSRELNNNVLTRPNDSTKADNLIYSTNTGLNIFLYMLLGPRGKGKGETARKTIS